MGNSKNIQKEKEKEKKDETNEGEEIYILPEKGIRGFMHSIKMEYQKIKTLLGDIPDNVPRFSTKKWIKVHDQSEKYDTNKKI